MEREGTEVPREVLVQIFRRLAFEARLLCLPLVSKSWNAAALDPLCWESVDMQEFMERRREGGAMDRALVSVVDRSQGILKELKTGHCSDTAASYLAARCPCIRDLSLVACPGLTDLTASQIAVMCPRLESLDLSECPSVSSISLREFGLHCKSLRVLKRNLSPDIRIHSANTDMEAEAIAGSMPNLTHLELRNSRTTDLGLTAICQGCPNLEYLDLTGCSNLTAAALPKAEKELGSLKVFIKPTITPSTALVRYGHWQLYDERFMPEHLFV